MRLLQIHPDLRAGAEEAGQAQRGVGRDGPSAMHDVPDACSRDADPHRQRVLTEPVGGQEVFPQHLPPDEYWLLSGEQSVDERDREVAEQGGIVRFPEGLVRVWFSLRKTFEMKRSGMIPARGHDGRYQEGRRRTGTEEDQAGGAEEGGTEGSSDGRAWREQAEVEEGEQGNGQAVGP